MIIALKLEALNFKQSPRFKISGWEGRFTPASSGKVFYKSLRDACFIAFASSVLVFNA